MRRVRRYHLRCSEGFVVGEVNGSAVVWSKRSYWGRRFSDPDEARNWVRDRLLKLAPHLDSMAVVLVRRVRKVTANQMYRGGAR